MSNKGPEKSRMLFKVPEPGHEYHSRQSKHCWHLISKTDKSLVYECCKCPRHHHRKRCERHIRRKLN